MRRCEGLSLVDQTSSSNFRKLECQCHVSYYFPGIFKTRIERRTLQPRSAYRAGPVRCAFASAGSVSAQSVTEAVATLDKPLFPSALHSIASSLAWFGLAWIITRYVRKLAKENEAPEVGSPPAVPAVRELHRVYLQI